MHLDLQPWITRVRSQIPSLRAVGGAAELAAALTQRAQQTPQAFLVPIGESGGSNTLSMAVNQRVTERVGLVYVVRNISSPTGEQTHAELTALRAMGKRALVGWTPDPEHEETIFVRGSLVDFSNLVLWWQDEFATAYHYQEFGNESG